MKLNLFLLVLLFSVSISANSQHTAPYQFEDAKAIEINDEVIELLTSKEWRGQKMHYYEKSTWDINPVRFDLKVFPDGRFQHANQTGSWKLKGNTLIFQMNVEEDNTTRKPFIAGAFSIYKISENDLLLAKLLSKSAVGKLIYYLKPLAVVVAEEKKERERRLAEGMNPDIEESGKRRLQFAKMVENLYEEQLLPKPEKDFYEWDYSELLQDYRKLKGNIEETRKNEIPSFENYLSEKEAYETGLREIYFMRGISYPAKPFKDWSLEELKKKYEEFSQD